MFGLSQTVIAEVLNGQTVNGWESIQLITMFGLIFFAAGIFSNTFAPESIRSIYLVQQQTEFLLEQPSSTVKLAREPFSLIFFQNLTIMDWIKNTILFR